MTVVDINGGVFEPTRELWRPTPSEAQSTRIYQFKSLVSEKYSLSLDSYHDLWRWSVENPARFWEETWRFTAIKSHKHYDTVFDDDSNPDLFPKPTFFKESLLNFAENLLFPESCLDENAVAVIDATESTRELVSWKDLRERVRICATALRRAGLTTGDRVAGFVGNRVHSLVAMLATTSIGALWTGVSTDTGVHAVLERLRQIEPKMLFADNGSMYNGKIYPTQSKVEAVVAELPTVQVVVILEVVQGCDFDFQAVESPNGKTFSYHDFVSSAAVSAMPLQFEYLPPDHPVYILYSSGTTGPPKAIVHGALGTLIQHKKEHALQCDMGPGDRLFYFTTTTWMMWHWLVSALASGVSIVLYDGSPFRPLDPESGRGDMAMIRLIDELQITHFGTSAKYLSLLEQRELNPAQHPVRPVSLKTLKAIYSTGSPLAPSTFDYVYSSIRSNVLLGSITGGTDIISLFGAPCPILPVYRGEIQCRGLGMAVTVFDHAANDISSTGEAGELVCTKPFPAQPVMFWPPGSVGQTKYCSSYFGTFGTTIWHHGDFIRLNPQTGGLWMLGRSDGVLKPAGVRFGSAEIYNVVLKHFADAIEDSLCIGRRREGVETDETVILFVKLTASPTLPAGLAERIQATIRSELSPRHVPAIVDACPEIPLTSNGKKVENAVKQILCGLNIKTGASVANAACLDWYRKWAAEHP